MKKLKKFFAIMLSFIMIICFAACSANSAQNEQTSTDGDTSSAASSKSTDDESAAQSSKSSSEILVAYFSATGTTKGIAEMISKTTGADLYEITPADPYTDADLDYNDSDSRSTVEMNDQKSRPEISGSVENMNQYDIVFIGYPIWWGDAPRIISTFIESYDFSGKTIIPFCTSASSSIDTSEDNLASLCEKAVWLDGKRFSGSTSQNEIDDWINSLDLNK